jgi:hypothetical protein
MTGKKTGWRPVVVSNDEPIIVYLLDKVARQEQTIRLLCKKLLEK